VDPDSKRLPPPRRRSAGARAARGDRSLRVSVSDGRGRAVADGGLARWLAAIAPARWQGTVAVALVTDAHVRKLNQQYRHQDAPTDVLSFPAEDPDSAFPLGDSRAAKRKPRSASRERRDANHESHIPDPEARQGTHLGDVVIATGVARRQAREAGHSYATELRVLALHGLLHLLGYDHDRADDRGRMARAEARLRQSGGLAAGLIARSRSRPRARAAAGNRPRQARR
jgi:probable rRNA maturation factor